MRVDLGSRVNAPAWAVALEGFAAVGQTDNDIEIDISKARFADFLVLGRILILTSMLVSTERNVRIRMPNEDLLEEEEDFLTASQPPLAREAKEILIGRRRRQRLNCRLYLRQSGFESALRSGPLSSAKVMIVESGSTPTQVEDLAHMVHLESEQQEAFQEPQRSRRILSYRWLDLTSDNSLWISNPESMFNALGLSTYDATALASGILAELIENVPEHTSPGTGKDIHALIGANLIQPNYENRLEDFDEYIRGFVQWAASLPAPLLQVFVGDADRGMQASFDTVSGPNPKSPRELGAAIVSALDHHTGTSGSRGLWKVKEIVRSFRGTIISMTGRAVAGYVFSSTQNEHSINNSSPYSFPGTIIECNILAGPEKAPDPQFFEMSLSKTEKESAIDLQCETAVLQSHVGLTPQDLTTINARLEALGRPLGSLGKASDAGLVIAIDIPPGERSPSDTDIHRAIRAILDIGDSASSRKAIAVCFAGISAKLLSLVALDFNLQFDFEYSQGSASPPPRPILIVGPEKKHYWVGGTPLIRRILSYLSQSVGPRELGDLSSTLNAGQSGQLLSSIHKNNQLLRLDGKFIRLNLRPWDAIRVLTQYVSDEIAEAVADEQIPAVEGFYLTPTLRTVRQWIDLPGLLQRLECYRMAGFLLATGLEARISAPFRGPTPLIVRVGSIDQHLTSIFASSLTGLEATFDDVSLLPMPSLTSEERYQQWVVLCTDIISSGATVRRAIRELWSLGFGEIAVATVIDARDIDGSRESREAITVHGQRVPLFGLANVSVGGEPTENSSKWLTLIDPVIGKPLPVRYPRSKSIVRQDLYKSAIVRSDAVRLGHIRSSGRRHYSAYIDIPRLFRDPAWSDAAIRSMIGAIRRDNDDTQLRASEKSTLCIIYPGEPSGGFGYVARELSRALQEHSLPCVDPVPVARAVLGNDWVFPRAIQLDHRVRHVVVMDSRSKTGATLRNLIRLGSQPNVRMISCFAVVDGMTDLESMTLQQIRSVRAHSVDTPHSSNSSDIPINVKYLVRTAGTATDPTNCSTCSMKEAYSSLPAPLPESLEKQRDWLISELDIRSKENVFSTEATDLLGMPIAQEDCVSYLLWRSLLLEAALDTESRQTIVRKLTNLAEMAETRIVQSDLARDRDALIRLIATEPHMLELAPLWFTSVRVKLVALVQSLIRAPLSLSTDPALRVQALMVLARADVHLFSSKYAGLVRQGRDHTLVLRQTLIEAVRLINGASGSPDWLRSITNQIFTLSRELSAVDCNTEIWNDTVPIEELQYLAEMAERQLAW